METSIAHLKNKEQSTVLKAVKVLKADFKTEKSPYNSGFLKEILKLRKHQELQRRKNCD